LQQYGDGLGVGGIPDVQHAGRVRRRPGVAETALHRLGEAGAIVNQLWHAGSAIACWSPRGAAALRTSTSTSRLAALADRPIQTDMTPNFAAARKLARRYTLSFYDAR
jgi:hypothetical protein